jgi:predicted nucleic acid-binding Zn ribbon protein
MPGDERPYDPMAERFFPKGGFPQPDPHLGDGDTAPSWYDTPPDEPDWSDDGRSDRGRSGGSRSGDGDSGGGDGSRAGGANGAGSANGARRENWAGRGDWAPSSDRGRDGEPAGASRDSRRGGESERRGGDTERRSPDSERRGGDTERRSPDSERRGGDTERRSPDSERRGGDTEGRGGDSGRGGGSARRGDPGRDDRSGRGGDWQHARRPDERRSAAGPGPGAGVDQGAGTPAAQEAAEGAAEGPAGPELARAVLDAALAKRKAAAAAPRRRGGDQGTGKRLRGYSGPGPDPRDPQLFGDVLGRLMKARGWEKPKAEATVFAAWERVVGPDVAKHSRPVKLDGGVLTVEAESTAWATQLRMLAAGLLKNIAGEVGHNVVTKLNIHGPAAPSWSRGPRRVQGRGPRDTYG